MRSDDLGPHLQHVHKMFSLSERQTVIEKSERSAMRVAAIDCYKAKDYAKLIRKCAIGEESPLNTFASQDYLPYTVSANIGCLFQALRLEPFSVTYLSMRAAAYMSVGLHQEALDDAYSAIHIVHFKPEAFHRLARTFVKLGDGKTAGFHDTLNKISSTQPTPAATASQFIEFSLELMERLSQEGADSNAENAPDQAEPGRRFSVDKTRELIIEARRKVFSRSSHSRKN